MAQCKNFNLILSVLIVCVLEPSAGSNSKEAPPLEIKVLDVLDEIEFERHFRDNPVFDHKAMFGSQEDYDALQDMSDETKRNRLLTLAKSHDFNEDSILSRNELKAWIKEAYSILDHNEVEHKFAETDGNGDSLITVSELVYARHSHNVEQELGRMEFEKEQGKKSKGQEEDVLRHVEHDKVRFQAADLNKDKMLNKTEFAYITHPENYQFMINAEVELTMGYADSNKDGFITLKEFLKDGASKREIRHVSDTLKQLDTDGDNRLSRSELQVFIFPNTLQTAIQNEVSRLITEADENADGVLTLEEIVNKESDFIQGPATNYGHNLRFVREEL